MRRQILWIVAAVLLLRLPFLNQAWQLDDYYYLKAASYARADPLHPYLARYVFQGVEVDMRGHPHPPGLVWLLAGILWFAGSIRELPFHAAFIPLSLLAGLAMLALARRFIPQRAVEATLLGIAAPAFASGGNTLMADVPFLAFWLVAVAVFLEAVDRRSALCLGLASVAMACASIVSYQGMMLAPILGIWLFRRAKSWRMAWLALAMPLVVIGGYQLWVRMEAGALPATTLAGHLTAAGLFRLAARTANALALTGHLAWVVCPLIVLFAASRCLPRVAWIIPALAAAGGYFLDANPLFWVSFAVGGIVLLWMFWLLRRPEERWLAEWLLLFFGFCLLVFFAGAARYLLPLSAPLALLVARVLAGRPWALRAAAAAGFGLGLACSTVAYDHNDGYRLFVESALERPVPGLLWVNGEWGLRQYAEERGARPLTHGTVLSAGDSFLHMDLAGPAPRPAPGTRFEAVARRVIVPRLPIRLMGLGARSAFETVAYGLRPFDVTSAAADVVTLFAVRDQPAPLAWLAMGDPASSSQVESGVYASDNGQWSWMSGSAAIRLRVPAPDCRLKAEFTIPPNAPGRRVRLTLDGRVVAERVFPDPGAYILLSEPLALTAQAITVGIEIDRDFTAPPDVRRFGMILSGVGLVAGRD